MKKIVRRRTLASHSVKQLRTNLKGPRGCLAGMERFDLGCDRPGNMGTDTGWNVALYSN